MRSSQRRPVVRLRRADPRTGPAPATDTRADTLAGEEPLEIRLVGRPYTVTMRTPGKDFDLVAGFLVSEGLVVQQQDITEISYGPGVDPDGRASYNTVNVTLAAGVPLPTADQTRQVYTSASCGICGTSSIEAVTKNSPYAVDDDDLTVGLDQLLALPGLLRSEQQLFRRTGGTHAAAVFTVPDDRSPELLWAAEDVGRHNAVDKVVGRAWREGRLPLRGTVLQVSGRASFELVQKASMAGIPMLSAVSAPSSLAVQLADDVGMTLAGFVRGDAVNVYSRPDRINC